MMKKFCFIYFSLTVLFFLSACDVEPNIMQLQSHPGDFVLQSSAMVDDGDMPIIYTCDGDSVSPPLNWRNSPKGTESYALIMHHNAPEGIHWYWTLYNIDAAKTQIEEGEILGDIGTNSVNNTNQYAPPCSKGPGQKRYPYTLYALSSPIVFASDETVNRKTLLGAIKDITLGSTQLSVNFERSSKRIQQVAKKHKPNHPQMAPANAAKQNANSHSSRCEEIKHSVSDAGFEQSVSVSCDEEYGYIRSNTYPNHEVMTGITATNEQIPVPALNYAAPIKLSPKKAQTKTTIDAALGVAVNGVPIYDYSSQGELDVNHYDSQHDTVALGQLDNCGGHAGRGDDYHYHASPTCMINTMKNQKSDAIIGWAYDGYPLYGNQKPDGSDIANGELDVCNGQADETFGYRYHTSTTPPYIIQCLVGEVDTSKLPRVAPLSGDTQGIRAELKPPQGKVDNLTHTIAPDGSPTMRYEYQGKHYFTTYSPSNDESGCYNFTQKTISNGGVLQTGTFCRNAQPNNRKPMRVNQPSTSFSGENHLKLEAWADNWFAAYIGDKLLIEDSVPITTERSFNAESIEFSTDYPIHLNLIIKDFKQNDTGLEYIGAKNQQMGDGGFIMQITNTDNHEVVAVSDESWKCDVLHRAPLNKLCENETNPVAGQGVCTFMSKEAPDDWLQNNYDDASWPHATEHPFAKVGPKDGYDEIKWDPSAKFIWGDDLETVNTLICKTTIEQP